MKKLSLILAMLLLSSSLLPTMTACQKEVDTTQTVTVSIPFEDKGFKEVAVDADAQSLSDKFLDFPNTEQKKLAKRGFSASNLIKNFNTVYSTLAEMWNHGKLNNVVYTINMVDDGVADTRGAGSNTDLITMYYGYVSGCGESEVDCITHELTHVTQEGYDTGYGGVDTDDNGSWIVEGMTDYSRYMFGMYPAGFALPAYNKSHSYTNSYRVTARFFVWIEENICPTFAEQMNEALRSERYTSQFFNQITGYGLKELWAMYDADGGRITDYKTGIKTAGSVYRTGSYTWKTTLDN